MPSPTSLTPTGQALADGIQQQLQTGDIEVPLLPEVANRVIALSQDAESEIADLAQLIQSDPSLAAHVMRIANSAAYTPNASLVSLQQAITRLGMNLICDIALAASLSTKMFKAPGFESHINDIWKHALATALWAKEIARACRLNVEATFLCGLLHSIGQPVTIQAACDGAKRANVELSEDDALALAEQLNIEVGSCVLKSWEMPMIICEALQYFNDYKTAPHALEQTMIVNASALFATHMLDSEQLPRTELIAKEVLADLNLYQDEVEMLLEKRDIVVSSMEAMAES
ncbi:MAG: histidine kinase [Cellvibrionaceae bacterium]|nr:histidine kinase [Cellvibrionaceae bacterium]|tara:strand:+ start:27523 stop:28386 length:864 start_codon:yes stop_codon:yes gene_type:complete